MHTTGPWEIVRLSDYTGNPSDTAIRRIKSPGGTTVYSTEGFTHTEADAHLIRAAPTMLDALLSIADGCRWRLLKGDDGGDADTLKQCEVAIAKARARG